VMVVPSNAAKARQFHVPAWAVRASLVILPILVLIGVTLLMDYRFVANQVFENRELQAENRRLRQSVQLYQNRMDSLESSLERIENFSARLKMITNLMDRDSLSQQIDLPVPSASSVNTATADRTSPPQTREELELRDSVDFHFESLNNQSLGLEQNLHDLYELLSDQKSFLNALPTKKPADGYFTSGFGIRVSPLGDGVEKMHEGLDIANSVGAPIRAPAQGSIVFAGRKSGYGQIVVVDHGYGLETWYGHTSRILVKAGQMVNRGQTIALVGNSGRSTGSHLHYEVRVHGIPVDPLNYILEN
jgi:murein DD-endopeptidase MepM/ murein hydrolase activator NlpD